jgi:threonine dehydrogenase-like Zn-dependent dehydrogenase
VWAYLLAAPSRLEAVDVPAPNPEGLAPGRVLVRVRAGGLCGSDAPRFRGLAKVPSTEGGWGPMPIGVPLHEIAGEVLASRHPEVKVGSSVVGWADRSDGLAEVVETDGEQVLAHRPSLESAEAVLAQSVACVLHARGRTPVAGRRVAVVGLGPIGLTFAHAAREAGAAHVVGVDPVPRHGLAERFGLDRVVQVASGPWSATLPDADRPDLVIEAVGHQTGTFEHAVRAAAPGGTVLCFGINDDRYYPLDMEALLRKDLTVIGGVTRHRRRALARALEHLERHPDLGQALVTHRLGRTQVQAAYELASTPAPDRVKVVLDLA